MKKIALFVFIIIISLLHYLSPVELHQAHAVYQRLYYLPVILASYWFGLKGGLILAFISGVSYAPHILFQWSFDSTKMFTQYVEIVMFFVIASLVGILSNIQQLQKSQIENANEQIRRMDRLSLLGQLAAGLAHEIRNPLGSLIGSTEILKESLGEKHSKIEFVEIMQKELMRLSDKLNEFLHFAKPSPPQIIPNNLNDVVKASIELVEKQAAKTATTINTELDDSLPLIPMDAEQLKQIVLNLLLNAIQAMPDGGTVYLTTGTNAKYVLLTVEDEGPGISEEHREKIFEPFFTTKSEGTGLGLAIVKQLVDGMDSTINCVPSHKGAKFELRISNGKT